MFRLTIFSILIASTMCAQSPEETLSKMSPLTSYRKGHYRGVVEAFESGKVPAKTMDLQYIWASSYVELREPEKALEQFLKIDSKKLQNSEYSYLYPFYVRKVIQSINKVATNNSTNNYYNVAQLIDMVKAVPTDSPVRPYMDFEFISVLWANSNYPAIALLSQNLSDDGKAWLELAKFELGEAYNAQMIINSQEMFKNNLVFSNFVKTLDPDNYKNKSDLTNIISMTLRLPSNDKLTEKFVNRYESLYKDREYTTLIRAQLLPKSKGVQYLYQYVKNNPRVSLDMYTNVHAQLMRQKQFDIANSFAEQAVKYYENFYMQARGGIELSDNANYISTWYQKNIKKLSPEYHNQVIRALIRTDLKKAEQAADLGIQYNRDNPEFILKRGLLKEHFGKKEEAYRSYVDLIFRNAFGYSGVVAKQKEKSMREEFRPIFEETVQKVLAELNKKDLPTRLMLQKSLLVDEELAQYVDQDKMAKEQKEFDATVFADLNTVPKIPVLENYPKALSNFAPETQDYIENSVIAVMKDNKDKMDIARYYYKYRDLFKNSDIDGYLTFRMYFYIRDHNGYSYTPIYPAEIVQTVYPKPEFELIKKWSDDDKDLAYWMLGSFMAESHFRKRVYSSVGAVGFAQVMPYTAADIKRWLKKPYLSNYDFYDNLQMGVYYHKKMYQDMDNDVKLSLAAYNAGPTAVNRWRKKYQDIKDPYLFIEAIDYKETRNYVKIIIYNQGMYHLLDNQNLY